jgi:glucose-1-phosphate cytidylyltransferase
VRALKVVLFCGGLGLRMREGAGTAPKPMAMIGDHPLLWHVMRYYAHFGHTDFILCLGYGANVVKDYFLTYDETRSNDFRLTGADRTPALLSTDVSKWTITFVHTGQAASVGDRLLRVREHLESEEVFLANYADTLTDADLDAMVADLLASDAAVNLLAVPPASTHHLVELAPNDRVTGVRAMADLRQWENGGYFVMRPDVFAALRPGEDLVPQALGRLAAAGRVLARPHRGFWRAVDTFKDRAELEDLYRRGDCPWMRWPVP